MSWADNLWNMARELADIDFTRNNPEADRNMKEHVERQEKRVRRRNMRVVKKDDDFGELGF